MTNFWANLLECLEHSRPWSNLQSERYEDNNESDKIWYIYIITPKTKNLQGPKWLNIETITRHRDAHFETRIQRPPYWQGNKYNSMFSYKYRKNSEYKKREWTLTLKRNIIKELMKNHVNKWQFLSPGSSIYNTPQKLLACFHKIFILSSTNPNQPPNRTMCKILCIRCSELEELLSLQQLPIYDYDIKALFLFL